jgi:Holliday junction resolvase
MTTAYRQGRTFEYRIKYALMDKGYDVQRSPASKGPWDLKAEKRVGDSTVTLFIQAKANTTGYVPPKEWNLLYDYANARGGVPLVAFKDEKRRITYRIMTGRKSGRRKQPWIEWSVE